MWDMLIVIIIWIISSYVQRISFTFLDTATQMNLLSSVIGTCVSLSGFILAALTIIVTFKSNIKAKRMEEASDALELIFSSKHYPAIINVFKSAITEYCLLFLTLYFVWAGASNMNVETLNKVNISGIIVTSLVLFRSLLTLFKVIELPEKKLK